MSSLFNKSGGGSRFQLPALNLNFGSITDGTNIPPPPDSPVQKVPTPPQTPPPVKEVAKETEKDTQSNVVSDDSKETPQQSIPAPSNEGQNQNPSSASLAAVTNGRPSSQGGSSFLDERKSRRSSGWFRRIRTGETGSKRISTMNFEEPPRAPTPTATIKKPSGPPPPMIPELTDLEKDEGSLGDDLFKNIK
ncbi:hypothetical protein NW759_013758 [Fusarium solani]|nr:hypothetical protein NW759_013758 [Fusarium solani]